MKRRLKMAYSFPQFQKNEIDTIRRIQEITKSLRIDVSKNLIVIQISNEVLQ